MTTERLDDLMCMACEEMQLYYAYLDAVEEAKRKAQPWQCEVTVIPQGQEAEVPAAAAARPSEFRPAKPSRSKAAKVATTGFACDDPE